MDNKVIAQRILNEVDISKHKEDIFTIYSKSNCNYCEIAKDIIDENYKEYNIIMCDDFLKTPKDKSIFLDRIHFFTGKSVKIFPMIFYQSYFIGGSEDLEKFIKNNNNIFEYNP